MREPGLRYRWSGACPSVAREPGAQARRGASGAAVSLCEGLDETLTVMRLGLPASLERVLSSTNLIENLFSRVRDVGRGVKLWQGGTMVLRWTTAGVLEAQRGEAGRCTKAVACIRHSD